MENVGFVRHGIGFRIAATLAAFGIVMSVLSGNATDRFAIAILAYVAGVGLLWFSRNGLVAVGVLAGAVIPFAAAAFANMRDWDGAVSGGEATFTIVAGLLPALLACGVLRKRSPRSQAVSAFPVSPQTVTPEPLVAERVPVTTPVSRVPWRACPHCGFALTERRGFCPECGGSLLVSAGSADEV